MTPTTHRSLALLLVTALLIPATTTWAQSNAQQQFERAYFLESHEGDLESATDLYKKVAGDRTAPAKLTAEAKRRWGSCREELRSRDLATLMPPNAMAYLEIGQPGQHVENLADMLGLIGDPLSNLTGSVQRVPIPDSPGLAIPAEIFISPALIEQAKRFRGLAVALTGFAPPPAGNPDLGGAQALLVLHPGDAAEVRGLIETVAQFVEPTEPVGGFATIQAKPGITICFTHRLVIVGTSRDLVAGAVDRLTSFERDSLANRPDFKALAEQRTHALLFAFVDAKKTVQTVARMSGGNPDARQALGIAYGTLDAAHMQSLSLALGSSAKGLYADFAMAMDDGHNNFIYNLLRTPPLNGASLNSVPAGSAVVLAMGVNPAATPQDTERAQQQADRLRTFTGLDIGRELFANIREIALFVVPGERREDTHIPDAGLVIASNDAQKSQIVWEQLLSIPARVMGKELAEPDTKTLAGTPVQIYP
ncbi:MAG: hypothetical protein ACE5GE_12150, partial [Phycisphaerae bacterium]